jgi:hypothetical protein
MVKLINQLDLLLRYHMLDEYLIARVGVKNVSLYLCVEHPRFF